MRSAALLAAAGLAAGAQAQTGSATWLADVVIADDLQSVECTLSVAFDADTPWVAFDEALFDTLNLAGAEFGGITSWKVLNHLEELAGDLTTTDGDSLFGTYAVQLTIYGPFTDANPIDVLTFTWETEGGYAIADGGEPVQCTTSTELLGLWVGDDIDSATWLVVTDHVTEATFGWGVIPTPGSVALLGTGLLTLGGRRR